MSAHKMSTVARAQLLPISGPVLSWLPGESLYSLIARNHYYRGHQVPSHTVHAFFGTLTGNSLQSDMTEISVLVARTEGRLGTAQEVLDERTLLRFYRLFSERSEDRFLSPARRTTDSIMKYPLGLRSGRVRAKHPLKGCSVCLEQDREKVGFQYWRLTHQFPGVWVCLEHDQGLQEITVKPTPQQKFLWQTPAIERLQPLGSVMRDGLAFSRLKAMSQLVVSVTSDKQVGVKRLADSREDLCRCLRDAGDILPSGRLRAGYKNRVAFLCNSLVEFASLLRGQLEFATLPDNANAAFRLLSRYVNGRSVVKPLDRLVITAWIEQLALEWQAT